MVIFHLLNEHVVLVLAILQIHLISFTTSSIYLSANDKVSNMDTNTNKYIRKEAYYTDELVFGMDAAPVNYIQNKIQVISRINSKLLPYANRTRDRDRNSGYNPLATEFHHNLNEKPRVFSSLNELVQVLRESGMTKFLIFLRTMTFNYSIFYLLIVFISFKKQKQKRVSKISVHLNRRFALLHHTVTHINYINWAFEKIPVSATAIIYQ